MVPVTPANRTVTTFLFLVFYFYSLKVIPPYCITHPYCTEFHAWLVCAHKQNGGFSIGPTLRKIQSIFFLGNFYNIQEAFRRSRQRHHWPCHASEIILQGSTDTHPSTGRNDLQHISFIYGLIGLSIPYIFLNWLRACSNGLRETWWPIG